jgi:predicted nucleic acid-binding protein
MDPAIWIQKSNNLCPQGAPLGTSTISEKAAMMPGLYQTGRLKKDPTDNIFLACALEAIADFIVSGD